jgi:hypothetical protein
MPMTIIQNFLTSAINTTFKSLALFNLKNLEAKNGSAVSLAAERAGVSRMLSRRTLLRVPRTSMRIVCRLILSEKQRKIWVACTKTVLICRGPLMVAAGRVGEAECHSGMRALRVSGIQRDQSEKEVCITYIQVESVVFLRVHYQELHHYYYSRR